MHQDLLERQTQPLVIHEKKCPIFTDWPAAEGAEIVHDDLGHRGAKRIAGGEGGILVVLKDPAVKLVAAAFGNGRDVANAPEFGGVVDFTHTDFGDSVERRKQLGDRTAVPCARGTDAIDAHRDHVDVRAGD